VKLATMIQVLVLSLAVSTAAEARGGYVPVVYAPRCAPVVTTPVVATTPVVVYDAFGRPVIVQQPVVLQQPVVVQQPIVVSRRGYGRRFGSRRWWR
jgi:hypothetical protein